ncbi:MAG: ATP-binding cassette domain-containing protein, partial [Planctomycetia bacterium]|nr:ATP-binding cassette domain-containing protein [Planctomycetia bacterium]
MASVSLESVSKVFAGNVLAVDHISLHVTDGEFLVLLGPSGCGKSTTLRMIAGLEEVTEGEIRIGDRIVSGVAPKDRDIAMVFQDYALYPHMSVYKNMAFGLELRYGGNSLHRTWKRLTSPTEAAKVAAKRRGIREAVRQTAQALKIEHLLDRMPRQLSGGERQRVALGRAIVRQPAVFLFDEPLSNLDAKLRLETRRELNELHQRLSTTIVYVTHDQTEAMTRGERIVVMNCGEIQQIGSPMEVYDQPETRFVAGFIGSPPMNFVSGSLVSSADRLSFVAAGLKVEFSEKQEHALAASEIKQAVELGVRPEDIIVEKSETNRSVNSGCVSLVEPLGDCKLLHIAVGSDQPFEVLKTSEVPRNEVARLVCKVEPRANFATGDCVRLRFKAENVHVFDAASGKNVTLDRGSSFATHCESQPITT